MEDVNKIIVNLLKGYVLKNKLVVSKKTLRDRTRNFYSSETFNKILLYLEKKEVINIYITDRIAIIKSKEELDNCVDYPLPPNTDEPFSISEILDKELESESNIAIKKIMDMIHENDEQTSDNRFQSMADYFNKRLNQLQKDGSMQNDTRNKKEIVDFNTYIKIEDYPEVSLSSFLNQDVTIEFQVVQKSSSGTFRTHRMPRFMVDDDDEEEEKLTFKEIEEIVNRPKKRPTRMDFEKYYEENSENCENNEHRDSEDNEEKIKNDIEDILDQMLEEEMDIMKSDDEDNKITFVNNLKELLEFKSELFEYYDSRFLKVLNDDSLIYNGPNGEEPIDKELLNSLTILPLNVKKIISSKDSPFTKKDLFNLLLVESSRGIISAIEILETYDKRFEHNFEKIESCFKEEMEKLLPYSLPARFAKRISEIAYGISHYNNILHRKLDSRNELYKIIVERECDIIIKCSLNDEIITASPFRFIKAIIDMDLTKEIDEVKKIGEEVIDKLIKDYSDLLLDKIVDYLIELEKGFLDMNYDTFMALKEEIITEKNEG